MPSRFEITEDSIIADILREYPECIEVFDKHDMPCRTCMGASTGTLAKGAMMHDVDLEVILAELRKRCAKANDGNLPPGPNS